MENKNNFLIILVVILSLLVGGLLGFVVSSNAIYKNMVENKKNIEVDESINKEENQNEKEIPIENNYSGVYTVKYKEDAGSVKNNLPSTLTLNEDKTFEFEWNFCAGMMLTSGYYKIENNKIILYNLSAVDQNILETNLQGRDTLEFVIVSKNEIYLNLESELACTIVGNEYGSFVRQ